MKNETCNVRATYRPVAAQGLAPERSVESTLKICYRKRLKIFCNKCENGVPAMAMQSKSTWKSQSAARTLSDK